MKIDIYLSPVRSSVETACRLDGSVLTLNGIDYDLSELPDGASADHPELGRVTRNGDDYALTIRLGHGPNAPQETRFPEPIVLVDHEGPVPLPPYDAEPEEEERTDELD